MSGLQFSERSIARALVHAFGMFPPRRYLAVENVSWGLLPWEADLLCMSGNGYLQEVEIKVSVADLRRDLEKPKHRLRKAVFTSTGRSPHTWIRRFWYAMPDTVWNKVVAEPPIPADAGVVLLYIERGEKEFGGEDKMRSRIVRPAKTNAAAIGLTAGERYDLARLGVLRYWSRDT